MIIAQTYTEVALVVIAIGAVLQMLLNNIGRKNRAEEARMNYKDGHVRGVQLYKEMWREVHADYQEWRGTVLERIKRENFTNADCLARVGTDRCEPSRCPVPERELSEGGVSDRVSDTDPQLSVRDADHYAAKPLRIPPTLRGT
jgi:hypothetical protein